MKKLLVGFLIAIFAIGINFTGTNNASAKDKKVYEDGEYTVDYTVDVEHMNNFIENKPEVFVKDGKSFVTMTFNAESMIKGITVKEKKVEKSNVREDLADYTFEVKDLDEEIAMIVHVDTPGHTQDYSFKLSVDTTDIPLKDLNEESTKIKVYDDGQYAVPYTVDVSAMERFMTMEADVNIENGKSMVTVTFNSASYIEAFEVHGNEATRGTEDKEENTVEYTFAVEDLDEELASEVFISAGPNPSHEYSIKLDTSDIPYTMVESDEEQGEPGPQGEQGEPGSAGKDGKDGEDGKDGKDGKDGQSGTAGSDNNGGSGTTGGSQGINGSTTGSGGATPEPNPKTSDNAPILLLTIVLLGSGIVAFRKVAIK